MMWLIAGPSCEWEVYYVPDLLYDLILGMLTLRELNVIYIDP